ncbi:MAG TPA: hypothetical protein VGK19_08905 [Capsulimonadaceae bacterium]
MKTRSHFGLRFPPTATTPNEPSLGTGPQKTTPHVRGVEAAKPSDHSPTRHPNRGVMPLFGVVFEETVPERIAANPRHGAAHARERQPSACH